MNKIYLLLLSSLLLLIKAIAQNGLPPAYELTSHTVGSFAIDSSYIQLFADPEGKWNIEQVSKPPVANMFRVNGTREKGINYTIKTYWLRFRIYNRSDREMNLRLLNTFGDGAPMDEVELYSRKSNGNWSEQRNGLLVPLSESSGDKILSSIPVQLQPQKEVIFYLRIHSNFIWSRPDYFNVKFQSELAFYKTAFINSTEGGYLKYYFLRMLFIGVFLATIIFSLYNFILIREKAYLYYLIYLSFYCITQFPYQYWFLLFPQHPGIFYWGGPIFWILVHAFLVLFVREYVNARLKAPLWNKLLIASIILMPVYLAVYCLTVARISAPYWTFFSQGIDFSFEVVVFTIALTLIHLSRKQDQPARFLLLALAPFLLVWSVIEFGSHLYSTINYLLTGHDNNPLIKINFFFYAEFFTTSWIVIFFSTALTRRYNQTRRALQKEALEKARLEKEKETERSKLIEEQKIELEKQVTERTAELKQSLEELKSTQAQLIQSEKMASLGELTAGIAHEIQNPLNFVNNFSEVNNELVDEMKAELATGNVRLATEIADDIKQNLEKINHHGRRADAIVKGMLQHSRISTGQKEPTDINALADEYLRLSYHGMRAKDKSFNATLTTDFDPTIGKVNIVPQEFGRVLLNLFNNAFYAVMQKKQHCGESYEPVVSVCINQVDSKVQIRVKDNGTGMPQKIVNKIFQPFFTTKPTGQGTGLGLSMSYDIIKAHGGEIRVESKEREGTTFIIQLSIV